MKLFHLSDLHIGKQLHRYNLCGEQREILHQIVEMARLERPDVVILAGDIYDGPVPSAEAVSVFDTFLTDLCGIGSQLTVLIIAGNHDSAKRFDFASSILAKHRVYIAGMPPRPQRGENSQSYALGLLRRSRFLSTSVCEAILCEKCF